MPNVENAHRVVAVDPPDSLRVRDGVAADAPASNAGVVLVALSNGASGPGRVPFEAVFESGGSDGGGGGRVVVVVVVAVVAVVVVAVVTVVVVEPTYPWTGFLKPG